MGRWLLILVLWAPLAVAGRDVFEGPKDETGYYLSFYLQADKADLSAEAVLDFSRELQSKKTKNDLKLLHHLFTRTHQRFLKEYQSTATFSEMIQEGKFNCLTGTALYAVLLHQMGFEYKIVETNYHIFLLVNSSAGVVLFEATDPIKGFISDEGEVTKRLAQYKQSLIQEECKGKRYYDYNVKLFNEVTLTEMRGLLHYNKAVSAFNQNNLPGAVSELDQAMRYYQSSRTEEFSNIILIAVQQSQLDSNLKEKCLQQISLLRGIASKN